MRRINWIKGTLIVLAIPVWLIEKIINGLIKILSKKQKGI